MCQHFVAEDLPPAHHVFLSQDEGQPVHRDPCLACGAPHIELGRGSPTVACRSAHGAQSKPLA